MPPAPTMPRIVAERTLDSKKKSTWLSITGKTCGNTPMRRVCMLLAPAARTPSTCLRVHVLDGFGKEF